jgi:RNase adaptor protein for sRNA GlmZ degradation
MNKNANPLDYILRCSEQGLVPYGFDILNAKDELKKLRDCEKELSELKQIMSNTVAWGLVNDRKDIYDLRTQPNPYYDQTKVVSLCCDQNSFNKINNGNIS